MSNLVFEVLLRLAKALAALVVGPSCGWSSSGPSA